MTTPICWHLHRTATASILPIGSLSLGCDRLFDGGYGALKIALRNPEHCVAVAALCPGASQPNRPMPCRRSAGPSVLDDLNQPMGTNPEAYCSTSVYDILRRNLAALRSASPEIYLDCGEVDEFKLHDGAVYLHKLLGQLSVPHTFRSVPGAGHADARPPSGRKRPFVSSVMR